jgi:hypothetical protein
LAKFKVTKFRTTFIFGSPFENGILVLKMGYLGVVMHKRKRKRKIFSLLFGPHPPFSAQPCVHSPVPDHVQAAATA